jgi:hypothetical protein
MARLWCCQKGRTAIKRQAARQASRQECPAQDQLIGFEGWIGDTDAGITLHFKAAGGVNDVDQADLREILDHHRALSIQFPFIVRRSRRWRGRFGQIGMAVVAARKFGVLEERRDPCATGERMLNPEGIGAKFGQNRVCSPAGMCAAQLQNGLAELG